MPKIFIDKDCVKFLLNPPNINLKNSSSNNKKEIYLAAVYKAYGDMSRHTLHYKSKSFIGDTKEAEKNRNNLKDQIAELLFNEEKNLFNLRNQTDFDNFHKRICDEISLVFTTKNNCANKVPLNRSNINNNSKNHRKYTFSDGQAQKILNMAWKYVYIFYNYYNSVNKIFINELSSFKNIINYLHCPIDNYVLEAAGKNSSNYYIGLPLPEFAWSQLTYNEYFTIQNDLRKCLKNNKQNICPFLWELQNYPFKLYI